MDPLKLIALDPDDLIVVSAHVQDAEVKVSDIHWMPAEKRLVIALSRYDWAAAQSGNAEHRRCFSALRFDRVSTCKCRDVQPGSKDRVLNLVGVTFSESDPPAGYVTLMFSDGAALRLSVECLEAAVSDIGPTWEAAPLAEGTAPGAHPRA